MKKNLVSYFCIFLFLIGSFDIYRLDAQEGDSVAGETENPIEEFVRNLNCEEGDSECILQIPCPEGLDENECATYRDGLVKAARVEPTIARAGNDQVVLRGSAINLKADQSQVPSYFSEDEIEYWWDFGDLSEQVQGHDVSHVYSETGDYEATLVVKTPEETSQDQITVKVTDKALFLIISRDIDPLERANILTEARRSGFLVYELLIDENDHEFVVENNLMSSLLERSEEIRRSKLIIGLTRNSIEVSALARFGNHLAQRDTILSDKYIVVASDSLTLTSRRAQPLFDVFQPESVLVVSPELIETVIEGGAEGNILTAVQRSEKDFALLGIHSRRNFGKVKFYNFLSHFINLLINRGVSTNTILLILMLPIVATIIAFARQIVGIKSFGVYIPTILTLTFVAIGFEVGLLLMFLILAIGTGMRVILKRLRLLYLPRMAMVITMVSIGMLVFFFFARSFERFSLLSISVFPILILIMLIEEFIKVQIEHGARHALLLTGETIFMSLVTYFIVSWTVMRNLLLSYPEIILFCFLVNFALGKWTGLRLWEYYRFKEVIKTLRKVDKRMKKVKIG